ncbi:MULTISPECIES: lysogeny pheromone AimP family peptide [Bacillus]|nr:MULTISPECIES: lysogeny pheromone AimP family peptide [Bacillus]ASS60635.1 hypothetical protein CHN56_00090 [Bacillus velezensis]MBU8885953.1 lysogeny pheromone AimP family peptide [Bacillus sp. FJAT-27001]MCB5334819.1 hypothetical protein [Bacillus amyloliquefaciens]OAZ62816.1 hypothetical protein SRCM100169_02039 [Bacillus siamensis]QDK90373.1 lysogeny pheromone AimP family peptide [Bacillus velezensis]
MKNIILGIVILLAMAVGFVAGQQSIETASVDHVDQPVKVASPSRGA